MLPQSKAQHGGGRLPDFARIRAGEPISAVYGSWDGGHRDGRISVGWLLRARCGNDRDFIDIAEGHVFAGQGTSVLAELLAAR